jgi:hypothetical protein
VPTTVETLTLPTKGELDAALNAIFDVDEFHIDLISERVNRLIAAGTEEGQAVTHKEIAKLAATVCDAIDSMDTQLGKLREVERSYSDLWDLANGDTVATIREPIANALDHLDRGNG